MQFKLEDYINDESIHEEALLPLDFVKMYLKELHLTQKKLASYFEMEDSNLHKYLTGKRKLNAELAMKLSSFSHTKPELWFAIQIKNELVNLRREIKNISDFKKYDYQNLVDLK